VADDIHPREMILKTKFSGFLLFCSDFAEKNLKMLSFSVEKEFQWANVNNYQPLWMISVQKGGAAF
jgi:hypothetical protein